ncbi:hypothetical protein [[Kitasatospora] papulosa]|uniref:hypothetical protein n=1 Tax=[Kitasatospora] papulosa TaxID=1464011 RepID=UPI00363188DB
MIASACPVPGNKADAHAWRESALPAIAARAKVIADGAYRGTGLIVPHRRRAGRPLLRGQEENNPAPTRPRQAHLRPHEDLENPPRLPPERRRTPPRRRHHLQPRHDRLNQSAAQTPHRPADTHPSTTSFGRLPLLLSVDLPHQTARQAGVEYSGRSFDWPP